MAEYRINQASSVFPGNKGDIVVAEPGPFLNAAVISGVLTRIDHEESDQKEEPAKSSKK